MRYNKDVAYTKGFKQNPDFKTHGDGEFMELTQLKEDFIKYGGSSDLLEQFTDEQTSQDIVSLQKQLYLLKTGDRQIENSDQVKLDLEKLNELRSADISNLSTESDQFREHINSIRLLENRIKMTLGLKPKEFLILDDTLETVIALGEDACKEYIEQLPNHLKGETEDRINQLIAVKKMEQEREREYLEFIAETSEKLSFLSSFKPEQYVIIEGALKPNKSYQKWLADIFSIKKKLDKRIQLEKSLEENQVNDFKSDKRSSVYKLKEKVESLIKRYDLKE